MAAQRVQGYLEKHRIGSLFEDLMAKVIRDTPDEPIPYLIKALKKMYADQESKGWNRLGRPPSGKSTPSFSRSIGLTGTPISRQPLEDGNNKQSNLAKSWGESSGYPRSGGASKPSREYSRPWMSGSKPLRPKADDEGEENSRQRHATKSSDRASWNSSTFVPTQDFDELFAMKPGPRNTDSERSRRLREGSSWGGDSQDMQDVYGSVNRPSPSLVARRTSGSADVQYGAYDELEEELNVGKYTEVSDEQSDSNSVSSGYSSYKSHKIKPRHAAEEHRRQLQALLASKDHSDRGRNEGYSGEKADWEDGSTELLENADDLESEGVSGAHRSGARVSKTYKPTGAASESVRVSICARCARIITDEQTDRKSEVGSIFSTEAYESDNFESASQVGSERGSAGPPVWPVGFDSESEPSPRKGRHMYEASTHSPGKGRHMYRGSSFPTKELQPSRPLSASSENSDFFPPSKERSRQLETSYSSDNETEASYSRYDSPKGLQSRPWSQPAQDSASEVGNTDWGARPDVRRGTSRGFARYDRSDYGDSDN